VRAGFRISRYEFIEFGQGHATRDSIQYGENVFVQGVGDVLQGYVDSAVGALQGAYNVARHPINTVVGLATALRHPILTGQAIVNDFREKAVSLRGQGQIVGDILGGVATGGVLKAAKEAGLVAKVTTKLRGTVDDISRVRVGFDATTISTGGLGSANVYLAPKAPLSVGQSGRFGDLERLAVVGDELTPHHMPQAALGFTSRAEGGAIVLARTEHVLTRTFGFRGGEVAAQEASTSFRTVLARDIRDLRSIVGAKYNEGIKNLVQYYRDQFPQLIGKP
jgi:hypothetical protein